jgi:hypothetical protein
MSDEELVKRLRSTSVYGSSVGQARDIQNWMIAAADRIEALAAENAALREALSAANGYLLNAKIDLETGAPKRTAITTIEGGIRRVRAALQETKP